jgi:NADPH:quinone reductase-like Zn-dependent oxidoreductase
MNTHLLRAGYTVITTASPKHFELVRDRGADLVFDYVRIPTWSIVKHY